MSYSWRALPPRKRDGYLNFAEDEAIAEYVGNGKVPPTIGVTACETPIISLGRHEKVTDVNLEYCKVAGIPATRRKTGGIVILHKGDIIYKKIFTTDMMPKTKDNNPDVPQIYKETNSGVTRFLNSIGIPAEIDSRYPNDIRVGRRKIAGAAYVVIGNACIVHGSLLYDFDLEASKKALSWKPEDIQKASRSITSIKEHVGISKDEAMDKLYRSLLSGKEWSESSLTAEEIARTQELAQKLYSTKNWLFDEGTGNREGICFTRS